MLIKPLPSRKDSHPHSTIYHNMLISVGIRQGHHTDRDFHSCHLSHRQGLHSLHLSTQFSTCANIFDFVVCLISRDYFLPSFRVHHGHGGFRFRLFIHHRRSSSTRTTSRCIHSISSFSITSLRTPTATRVRGENSRYVLPPYAGLPQWEIGMWKPWNIVATWWRTTWDRLSDPTSHYGILWRTLSHPSTSYRNDQERGCCPPRDQKSQRYVSMDDQRQYGPDLHLAIL